MAILFQSSTYETRNAPRPWIEGTRLVHEGPMPGTQLRTRIEADRVVLEPGTAGHRKGHHS